MKRFALAITLVLMLAGSAFAQSVRTSSTDPLWGGLPLNVSKMEGVEVSPGTIDYVDSICWGRTFLLTTDSGSFTFMPNYSIELASDPVEYYSKIAGGAWTMTYKTGKQDGMLFGELTGGVIEWYMDKGGNISYGLVTANMNIKGGTGTFANTGGPHTNGTFHGTIDYSSGSPTIYGSLDLLF